MPNESTQGQPPPGFKLRHTLRGHEDRIYKIAWSQDGGMLATPSKDKTIRLWDAKTGELRRTLVGHTDRVWNVAFSESIDEAEVLDNLEWGITGEHPRRYA